MNANDLRVALNRAHETQAGLARRLNRSRSMVTDWIDRDQVPADWVPLVYEALELPMPESEAQDKVEISILSDTRLSADDKSALLALLRHMRERRG